MSIATPTRDLWLPQAGGLRSPPNMPPSLRPYALFTTFFDTLSDRPSQRPGHIVTLKPPLLRRFLPLPSQTTLIIDCPHRA